MLESESCLISRALPSSCDDESKWIYMSYSLLERSLKPKRPSSQFQSESIKDLEKKRKKSPSSCNNEANESYSDSNSLINPIGRDNSINCLIHCSRSDYGSIASLNRGFHELIRTGELYRLRRMNGITEHWVYFSCNLNEWEAYDPNRGRWLTLPKMAHNECFMFLDKESLAVGTDLLVFGRDENSHVVRRYSILNNSWSDGVGMNLPRCLFGSASIGEKAIVAGGDSQGVVVDSAELYNSEAKAWTTLPRMNQARKMCSPPVILAKVDANVETNKELASKYEVKGFPTIKIFRNEGKNIQDYKGPREADGIIDYLKKQVGPASTEIKSSEDAASLITDKKIIIVGVFPKFSGEEFENFIAVAEILRSDYDFAHASDAKLLPRGDSTVKGTIVRLFKPFDELFVDSKDFHVEALENFVKVASVPILTTFNKDPVNHPFVSKFFNSPNVKAMLFLNFSGESFDTLKSKYYEVASTYKGKGISFLIGDLDASQGALQYFGLKEDQVPLIILQENDGNKYLKPNVEPDQIAPYLMEYMGGTVKPFKKSEPIPEVNNEPVVVVVADNFQNVVNSGKNVLVEFYAPWCGHCKKLAPILEEVAISFQNDVDVVIAKMDATANDIPNEYNVRGYPTMYLSSASGKLVQYGGGRTADDFINFINKNRDAASHLYAPLQSESVKDEL